MAIFHLTLHIMTHIRGWHVTWSGSKQWHSDKYQALANIDTQTFSPIYLPLSLKRENSVYSYGQFRKRAFYLVTARQLWRINIQTASHVTKSRLKDQNSPLISLADRLSWNVGKCFTMTFSWSSVTLYFKTWSENYTPLSVVLSLPSVDWWVSFGNICFNECKVWPHSANGSINVPRQSFSFRISEEKANFPII